MIPIITEPYEFYKEFHVYKKCHFCGEETKTWHKNSNTPICEKCAKIHEPDDIGNMDVCRKCKITRYDETIKEPPYLTIQIDEMFIMQPKDDHLGETFSLRLYTGCIMKGYSFRFYSNSEDENYDYEVVVY